ncbi:hypothetical protein MKW92_037186 [Papaver armeniacum]|nr:hypothetical protein MKW92_037186 [Papaver armeniacum]
MAAAETSDEFELLTSNNYRSWEVAMLERFGCRGWTNHIFSSENRIELSKDKEVLEEIKKSCSAEMLPHVMYAKFAKEAWDWLAEAGVWTDLEKENYKNMLAAAATAREILDLDDVPEVDKVLTKRNYRKWKIYMKNVLLSKYLWTVVDGSDPIRSRSYKTKNHHALVAIRTSCGEDMFLYIDEENDAKDAWRKLEDKLGAATTASMVYSNETIQGNEFLTVKVDHEHLTARSNHESWVFCMKNYLIVQNLWGFLEEMEISDSVKDEEALDVIKVSCAPDMRAYILYMDCAKHAWEKLATVAAASTEDEVREHHSHCMRIKEAAEIRANLSTRSEADKVLTTQGNYRRWRHYVEQLLRSRFLEYDDVHSNDHHPIKEIEIIKEACGLRIIKEACGREILPYIYRTKSRKEALDTISKAFLWGQKDYMKYSRLLHAVQKNGFREQIKDRNGELWRGAHKFFRDFPEALEAEITEDGSTALHVAVRLGRVDFVRELLKLMTAAQTELKARQGNTAIAVAARGNNMEIVKMLVDKNRDLVQIYNEHGLHAVTIAAINGNEMIMRYLYPSTVEHLNNNWHKKSVPSLLTSAARLDAFDIVRDLLSKFPADYAALQRDVHEMILLGVLAEKPSAFPSGNHYGLLGGWMYRSAGCKTNGIVLKALKLIVPGVVKSREKHDQTAEIVQHVGSLLLNMDPLQLRESLIYDAIHRSTINGIIEVFEILIDTNPYVEHFKDETGRGLFQIAIIHRQQSIFQYMSRMGQRNQNMDLLDNSGNNALHCAAFWDPSSKLVHGPALQIQREMQWFQEVERVVPPRYKEMRNNEKLTPGTLFSREHKDLVKEAERWMKDMAQACIIVTTLIATVMFAAAFTLPGGSDQNTGVPFTLKSRAFKVFMISDVISLFASCTSLLIFFSILTARYAERDFLTSLPRRLILGLFTLFFSIATMMATFTATVVIVFRGEARSSAYIWVSILACVPVIVFALLQYRLFVNLISSTYGRGIFRSKRVVVSPLVSIGYG